LAGLRLGYVVADPKVLHAIRKLVNHSVYNVPVALQRAGLAALESGDDWARAALADYRAARDLASARVGAPHFLPDGGAYLFLDLSGWLDGDGEDAVWRLHDRLLDDGIALGVVRTYFEALRRQDDGTLGQVTSGQAAENTRRMLDHIRTEAARNDVGVELKVRDLLLQPAGPGDERTTPVGVKFDIAVVA